MIIKRVHLSCCVAVHMLCIVAILYYLLKDLFASWPTYELYHIHNAILPGLYKSNYVLLQ